MGARECRSEGASELPILCEVAILFSTTTFYYFGSTKKLTTPPRISLFALVI